VRYTAVIILLALVLMEPPRPALADSAPMQAVGRSVVPAESTVVAMDWEEVTIQVKHDPEAYLNRGYEPGSLYRAEVTADFGFVNPGPGVEGILVGFPLGLMASESQAYWSATVSDFQVYVGASEAAWEKREVYHPSDLGDYEPWAVWNMGFPPGETLVRVRYSIPLDVYRVEHPLRLWYVLSTGSRWAGPIGSATIRVSTEVEIQEADVLEGTTPGWRVIQGDLVWDYRDLEPGFDLEVVLENIVLEHHMEQALSPLEGWGEEECLKAAATLHAYLFTGPEMDPVESEGYARRALALYDRALEINPCSQRALGLRSQMIFDLRYFLAADPRPMSEILGEFLPHQPGEAMVRSTVEAALGVYSGLMGPRSREAAVWATAILLSRSLLDEAGGDLVLVEDLRKQGVPGISLHLSGEAVKVPSHIMEPATVTSHWTLGGKQFEYSRRLDPGTLFGQLVSWRYLSPEDYPSFPGEVVSRLAQDVEGALEDGPPCGLSLRVLSDIDWRGHEEDGVLLDIPALPQGIELSMTSEVRGASGAAALTVAGTGLLILLGFRWLRARREDPPRWRRNPPSPP